MVVEVVMSAGSKLTGLLLASLLCLPAAGQADMPTTHAPTTNTPTTHNPTTHRAHKVKKPQPPPPPLPSGTRGPVPQIPLDAIPAVAPQVSYQDGMLTIVAPNSTLGDILRGVRKHTAADIEIPANANERVATHLGPGPPRQIVAELLNGSHFNYILLGSPDNANLLTRVVLVAKTADTPASPAQAANTNPNNPPPGGVTNIAADTADAPDEVVDETPDQPIEAEQQPEVPADQNGQPGVKSPQQLLQEMQQRQLQAQQQQGNQTGQQPGPPVYPPPGMPRPPQQPPQQPQEQQ
jgi:hypothetical protein